MRVFLVIRVDNGVGCAARALTPAAAAKRALRFPFLKGAKEIKVRSYFGLPLVEETFVYPR